MYGLAYLSLVSRQRGGNDEPVTVTTYDDTDAWCEEPGCLHRVRVHGQKCPSHEDEQQ